MKILLQTMNHGKQYSYAHERMQILLDKGHDVIGIELDSGSIPKQTFLNKLKYYVKRRKLYSLARNVLYRVIYKKYINNFGKKSKLIDLKFIGLLKNSYPYEIVTLNTVEECKSIIEKESPDVVIVVGAPFLSKSYFLPNIKYINLHIGLIPNYRGLKCIEWAILNGDIDKIGYSIHELTEKLDYGRIYKKQIISIDKKPLSELYFELYVQGINSIIDESIENFNNVELLNNNGTLYYSIDFSGKECAALSKIIKI